MSNNDKITEQEYSFSDRLYEAVGNLGFWTDSEVSANEDGVTFLMRKICGVKEFNAMGYFAVDESYDPQLVEFASMYLILVKNVAKEKMKLIVPKLYELNVFNKNGMFMVDEEGNICFDVRFPVARDDIEAAVRSFIAEYMEIRNFLDTVYPYLLRLTERPEETDFYDYMKSILEKTEEIIRRRKA